MANQNFLHGMCFARDVFCTPVADTDIQLASFPGLSHLQFLIVYNMQKTEGEGLVERVTCVTSGRREGRHEGGGA